MDEEDLTIAQAVLALLATVGIPAIWWLIRLAMGV
jgi:hypothetical protein